MLEWVRSLDATQITALVGALVALITAFSTKGVAAYIRLMTYLEDRRARAIDLECDEQDLQQKDLKYIFRWQEKRIVILEKECKELREENLVCAEDRVRLRVELAQVSKEVARQEKQLQEVMDQAAARMRRTPPP